ncbi:MAG: Multimodular transpeptidase-transglycosylase [uncultured Rubrobacteraceae bacterium]|uniref:Multimodular transpeptidase-transglycosylase n=1 Tax=uncultured Rubrobacteraceae bacterium TaxID=349277 RepID=A0A6J4QUD6_9ACTN|nr:MAG: Multimodular transpeptidase-transglycosylase [uncultured Rubrobacteraceae bacterium]
MEQLFETSKKAPGRRLAGRGGKAPKKPVGRTLRLLRWCFNLVLILIVAALITVSGVYLYVIYTYDDQLDERYPDLIENSAVYNADGQRIAEFKAEENRRTIDEDQLGEYLPQAVVAVEDKRFYEHYGVDLNGIGRAAWEDLRAFGFSQGGSTITEQLTKNLYISQERRGDVSPWRRAEQAALSVAYERGHTKEEILTAYLNTVYFGDGAYGAEEAAETYFGKSAADLTVAEAAALAGFLHAPSTYLTADGEGSEAGTDRRNEVLGRMWSQGMISDEQLEEAEAATLEFAGDQPPDDPDYGPFVESVRREAERELGAETLEQGGLQIYTTLDPTLQKEAVDSIGETLYASDDPSGAVVSIEPQNGAIRALAGQDEDFNLALDARRQPGSAFKPFVLATALKEFVSLESTYYTSRSLSLDYEGETYNVQNYDGIERGRIPLTRALAESDNTVFVQLALDLGLNNVVETARQMGVTAPVDPYPSTALGGLGSGVSVLEMASAYSTFAASGIHREPYALERAEHLSFGESEPVYDHKVEGDRVLSSNQAAAANEAMRGVVQSGTASLYHDLDREIGRPSAGKTGTTDDFVDAWYVGYTPRLATAVWVGYPEGRTPMRNVHGESVVNGETLPMDIWSAYMAEATAEDSSIGFSRPDRGEFVPLNRGYAASPTPALSGAATRLTPPPRERLSD